MNSQLYTAASGLLLEERRLELIANNLANTSTPAYRPQRAFQTVYQRFGPDATNEIRTANAGVALAGTYEVPGPGPQRATGRDLDVAMDPDVYLTVDTPNGKRYTRAGALAVRADGTLTDASGNPLVGQARKPITGLKESAAVTPDGRVLVGENEVGRLAIVRDPKRVLRREGNNLHTADGKDSELQPATSPNLRPGWIEGSATDPVGELVQLIEAQRAFESYQKIVSSTMNEVNKKAATEIAG